jgi:ABC-type transport system involved in multi-copper enzyme maturation permease subunit
MLNLVRVTFKGFIRDSVFRGIGVSAFLFLVIPSVSTLSMRQVSELSTTLSLSLSSFILLLIALLLGGTSIWKDIERRYVFSMLSLPLSRSRFIMGKFAAVSCCITVTSLFLTACSIASVVIASTTYPPDRAVSWSAVAIAILFAGIRSIMLVACCFLLSTVSTSFFLPLFGSISLYLVGSVSQQVYDYIHTQASADMSPLIKSLVTALYYILPNFGSLDYSLYAIYRMPLPWNGIAMSFCYAIIYSAIILSCTCILFRNREL